MTLLAHGRSEISLVPRLLDSISTDIEKLTISGFGGVDYEQIVWKLGRFHRLQGLGLQFLSLEPQFGGRPLDLVPSLRRLFVSSEPLDLILSEPTPTPSPSCVGSRTTCLLLYITEGKIWTFTDGSSHFDEVQKASRQMPLLRSLQAYDRRFNDPVEIAAFRPLAASLAEVGLLVDEDDDEYKQE